MLDERLQISASGCFLVNYGSLAVVILFNYAFVM